MSEKRRIVERLHWWLRYFDGDTEKWKDAHPNYKDNPPAFDETALEADLREAADEIEHLQQEVLRLRVSLGLDMGEDDDEYQDRLMRYARRGMVDNG